MMALDIVAILRFIHAEFHYTESRYAECHYTECHSEKCHGAKRTKKQTNCVDSIIDLLLKHRVINGEYHLSCS